MSQANASDANTTTYECHDCPHRVSASGFPVSCPECGGAMRNIGVPRE